MDKDGFVPIKPRAKGRGMKRTFKYRKNEVDFNRLEVLDTSTLDEGIPPDMPYDVVGIGCTVGQGQVPDLDSHLSQGIQDHLVSRKDSMQEDDDIVLADLAEGLVSGKHKESPLALGVQQRAILKGVSKYSSESGCKKD